jgi:hypothetical protein
MCKGLGGAVAHARVSHVNLGPTGGLLTSSLGWRRASINPAIKVARCYFRFVRNPRRDKGNQFMAEVLLGPSPQ